MHKMAHSVCSRISFTVKLKSHFVVTLQYFKIPLFQKNPVTSAKLRCALAQISTSFNCDNSMILSNLPSCFF